MLDLDQAIRERHSTRCFCPNGAAGLVNGARLGPVCAIELQNPALAYGVRIWSIPGPPRRALIDEAQRRPPNIPPLPASFSISATSWALKSTVRRESLAKTRRDMQLQSCATGNFSARQWPDRLHAPGPWPSGCPQCRDVPANVAVGLDRTRPR